MEKFIQALVLAMVFEGVTFALFPKAARTAMLQAASMSDQGLRSMGGAILALALLFLFLWRLFA